MSTAWVGIDPGFEGALVAIMNDHVLMIQPMPLIQGDKKQLNLTMICGWLEGMKSVTPFVTVELQHTMPPKLGGGIANFNRGLHLGTITGILHALKIPYMTVSPAKWQKVMHMGIPGSDTKQRSIIAAQRLFPNVNLKRTERSTKLSDGIAEALLLAEFGRRVHEPAKA